jgi:hypothetical protein
MLKEFDDQKEYSLVDIHHMDKRKPVHFRKVIVKLPLNSGSTESLHFHAVLDNLGTSKVFAS